MSNIVPLDQMQQMAVSLVKSKLFGFETPEQAMAIMLIAQAEGRSPALAARDYHVIKGRPALKADAMLARFQQEGGIVEWETYTDTKVSGRFSHPKSSPKPVLIEWTLEMGKKIGLANNPSWSKYPRAMLRARCISEGVRTVYPGIAVGVYTVEETQDFEPRMERNITPTSGASERVDPSKAAEIDQLAATMQEFCTAGQFEDAVLEAENAALDADQMTYLWTQFDSATRRELKKASKAIKDRYAAQVVTLSPSPSEVIGEALVREVKKAEQSTAIIDSAGDRKISDAQRKRMEAIISKHKLHRDDLKLKIKEEWGRESFADLTPEEYKEFDEYVAGIVEFANQTEAL
jgi:hypothetical protein